MDILDHRKAKDLLADATVSAADVRSCAGRLQQFAQRYLPHFNREEQRSHALTILHGKLTGLQRKTTEPIAIQAGLKRRPLQLFVGAGGWDDVPVRDELRRHVRDEVGHPDGVFILDNSGFPKKGTKSCGVARQWCGRLGKVDNCQVGVFLAYASSHGFAMLDAQLYLPKEWATDSVRRTEAGVPPGVKLKEKWRIGLDLLERALADVPGRWVVGDDEFGRCSRLRQQLRCKQLRYVLDVPCNTHVRELSERRPPARPGGKPRRPVFERVDEWVARQPSGRWRTTRIRDGEKGPCEVSVLLATVQAKDEDGGPGARERLVVIRTKETKPQTWYTFANAHGQERRSELARVHGMRHRVEELFKAGNEEVGLDHYEVRNWVGWEHHMTLSMLALWFLELERRRLGEKKTGGDGATGACDLHRAVASAGSDSGKDSGVHQPCAAA
jgi:SRSO17 transposase